jgi:RNA polymerase sigma factor (sigma-70 family)
MAVASDAEIMRDSCAEPSVFAVIYDRHGAALLRFFSNRVGPDEAEALLSDAFHIAFERRTTFDGSRPSALPWLYGIGTNLLARRRRAEARRFRALARLRVEDTTNDADDDVIATLDAARLLPLVAEGLAALPRQDRETLLLYAWEGLSYEDIGRALSVPGGTVRSRISRARQRLREHVGMTGEEDDGGGLLP